MIWSSETWIPLAYCGADLVVAEHLRRGVGQPRAGEDDSCGADRDDAEPVAEAAEDPETESRDSLAASSRDLQTHFDAIRLSGSEHRLPPLRERPGPDPIRMLQHAPGAFVTRS